MFNTRPKCEDPLKGEGSTLLWCDVLSVTVGLVDIAVVVAIVACFVYIKVKSMATEAVKEEVKEEVAAGVGAVELVEIVGETTVSGDGEEKKKTEFNNPMKLRHRRHVTDDGKVYYENMKTGKTSWGVPPGFIEEKEETSETTRQ